MVAIFHASFDGAINQPSYDIVPASNKVRFLIFSVVNMLAATTLIIATKGSSAETRKMAATETTNRTAPMNPITGRSPK